MSCFDWYIKQIYCFIQIWLKLASILLLGKQAYNRVQSAYVCGKYAFASDSWALVNLTALGETQSS